MTVPSDGRAHAGSGGRGMKQSALVVTFVLVCRLATAGAQATQNYAIVDLGLLPGGAFAEASAVNDRGQIVGWGGTATGESQAILWDEGQIIDLGTLGGSMSRAWGINNRGQIVGESETATGDFHAFLWEHGVMVDLAEAGPFNRAFAINNRGEVAGHFQLDAVLWRRGTLIDLGIDSAGDINQRGIVAGSTNVGDEFHAVLWNDGQIIDLGTLPGGTSSAGRAVNNRNQAVGESVVENTTHAFLWDGQMIELAALVPGGSSFARDINNRGQIVGESMSDVNVIGGAPHAVLWNGASAPIDLGTLPGETQSTAAAINQQGLIVGYSGPGGFAGRAVAWVPQH
jgi:probable HAF family extracellular repeat protein